MNISIFLIFIIGPIAVKYCQIVNHKSQFYQTTFVPISDKDLSPGSINTNLIETKQIISKYDCFSLCKNIKTCVLILIKLNQCSLYSQLNEANQIDVQLDENSIYLYRKLNHDSDYERINLNLKYHWPFNNDLIDSVSNVKMNFGHNASFTTDRLNSKLSAIKFDRGYLQAPTGTYFSGDFTITAWVKLTRYYPLNRLFEFGSSNCLSVIRILLTDETKDRGFVRVWSFHTSNERVYLSKPFKLNKWHHFAVTLNATLMSIYLDGLLVGSDLSKPAPTVNYTNNFVGKDCGNYPVYGSFELDDLKIFNSYLIQSDIIKVLNSFY